MNKNLGSIYVKGRELTWHGFASRTKSMGVLMNPQLCGPKGARTIFVIALTQGQAREITRYSLNAHEDEVLLPPGCRFRVMDTAPMDDGLLIVQLQEIASREWILDLAVPSPAGTDVSAWRIQPAARTCPHAPARSAALHILARRQAHTHAHVRTRAGAARRLRSYGASIAAVLLSRLCRMWRHAGAGGDGTGGGSEEAGS